MDKDKLTLYFIGIVAAAYLAFKADLIPDSIPLIGMLDDTTVVLGVLIAGIWYIQRRKS